VQELVLVKAPKPSMKFSLVGSGLSLTEKAAATMVKVGGGGGGTFSTSVGFGGASRALKALDFFDLGSSTSDAEAATPVPCQKCS
jgi:hypothetical protein